MSGGKCVLLFVFILFAFSAVAQKKSKAQLQKEKQQNLAKISEVEKILTQTAAQKKNSLGELNALNQRIKEQENLISSIKEEVRLLDTEISENNDIISVLEEDIKKLKAEYASMLYAAQKANNSTTRLMFLFSSKSFDQLMMRLKYMEQYGERRKMQAEQIVKVQDELSGHVKYIQAQREEKNTLLNDQIRENEQLASLKQKQNKLVRTLVKEEKKLKRDLDQTKKAVAKLDNLINEIIKEEMARASASKSKSAESIALSSSFEENKNKFPWPVASGFVSVGFGRQNHPVLKGIVVQNNGVNIQTKEDEKVKSIFSGEVRRVAFIPTLGSTVIINHGEYLTVYAGLKEVFVKAGQKVSTNQEIGRIFSNHEGVSELRFQIFKNTTPLDPELWLKKM
ncbi:MAG TPA: peptidoglycan DD-metalloendopeptidase family protein [Ohtaekwangia sp.]|nr:peptidoglycan DD-metalloendopeptidase family protein [Ohtaekwangia sp.]